MDGTDLVVSAAAVLTESLLEVVCWSPQDKRKRERPAIEMALKEVSIIIRMFWYVNV